MNKVTKHCGLYGPVAIVGVLLLALLGCSSKSVLDEEPDATLTVSASPSSVEVGETAVVEATVTIGGTPRPDQAVSFTVDPTSAGYFTPTDTVTDADGVAATIFTATATGSAQIQASVGGGATVGSTGMNVTGVQTGSGSINITVSPSLILANGTDTSVVVVTVRDQNAQPAPDNTLIKLTAGEKFVDVDGNGYWSVGIDSLVFDANSNGRWDAFGLIPSTAQTSGGGGQATVNYVAGSDAATVYVKATVDDNGIQSSAERSLQLTPDAVIHSIYLASDSINLVVRQTGGIETALLHATGYDVNGNPVPEGQPISFIITDAPDTVVTLDTLGFGPYQTLTNSQGVATVPIRSGTKSGTVRIRAYTDNVMSNAAQVLISAGPPAYIVVGSEYCNIDYWDNVGEKVEIVAVVSDIYMNPVNDSTVVYFTTDEGTMKSHEERTQELEGIATTKWIAGNNVPTADGRVLIIAETAGKTVIDTGMFFNTHLTDTLIVLGMPASLPADGATKTTVTVYGVDLNGNPVIGGTEYQAEAIYVTIGGGTLEDGCYSSMDYTKITSATLNEDRSLTGLDDNGIGAYDVITFWSGTAVTALGLTLTTGNAFRGNSLINGPTTVVGGEVANYSATIKDRYGNPLGDHTLTLTASDGVVANGTQETDGYGEAFGFVWTAPAAGVDDISVTLTLTDSDPRGGIILTKKVTVQAAN